MQYMGLEWVLIFLRRGKGYYPRNHFPKIITVHYGPWPAVRLLF